ncbi:hypothetical protein SAMN05216562_2856 [Microbulbifer marinus]|uniref:Secreted protein n=1 Tax=Microbulbifer marinus TaxID=658218 RepID=A0A1H4AKY3_9GAMM|nr:hypothetical protein SAMN05216562_2856 [Microbulbifer marinus]
MLKYRQIVLITLATLCASTAWAEDRYVCRLGNSQRIIEVIYASPPSKVPCEVSYTKAGSVQTLWRSQNEIGYCETRAREFAQQQTGWGWHCAEPGEVVSDLVPAAQEQEPADREQEKEQRE